MVYNDYLPKYRKFCKQDSHLCYIGKIIESASFDFVYLLVGIFYNCILDIQTIYRKQ